MEMGLPFYVVIHVKVYLLAGQRKYLHFSVIFKAQKVVGSIPGWTDTQGLLSPQPPTLQSNTLPTEPIQLRLKQ